MAGGVNRKFNQQIFCFLFRDSILIVLFDALMGFIGAIVIFSVTGFAAKSAEMSLEEIPASSGKYSLFSKSISLQLSAAMSPYLILCTLS